MFILELSVTTEDPRLTDLTFAVPETKDPAVTAKLEVTKEPCEKVIILVDVLSESARVTVIPEPLIVTPLKVLPAVVSVPVPVNVIVPLCV
jgi:hypothetical protein